MRNLLCTTCLLLIGGCGTIMHGPTQDIVVTSNPPGATVTTTTFEWIRTPGTFKLPRTKPTTLTARLSGYEDDKQEIKSELTLWVFGNTAGSLYGGTFMNFLPVAALIIVDFTTGSLGVLSPAEVHFELVPKEKKLSVIISPSPKL